MKDRVPVYPGRVKLVPVSGQENVYDMTRADQPTQQGDPLNKATLLKDATAALFGLGTDAVPDDVLAYVGKYAQHWWKRTKKIIKKSDSKERNISYSDESGTATECNISYSSNISVSDGSLVSPVNITVSYTHQTSVLNGKYFIMTTAPKGDTDLDESKMYFGQSSVKTKSSGGIYYTYITCQLVSIETYEPEYVHSSSRSAYPDSGEQGGYAYQYLGIPFENAATAPKIATGSYVGTGKYGSSNPNSLTFEFGPKLVLIFTGTAPAIFLTSRLTKDFLGTKKGYIILYGSKSSFYDFYTRASINGKTLSWYYTGSENSTSYQLNSSGETYHYIAIG